MKVRSQTSGAIRRDVTRVDAWTPADAALVGFAYTVGPALWTKDTPARLVDVRVVAAEREGAGGVLVPVAARLLISSDPQTSLVTPEIVSVGLDLVDPLVPGVIEFVACGEIAIPCGYNWVALVLEQSGAWVANTWWLGLTSIDGDCCP